MFLLVVFVVVFVVAYGGSRWWQTSRTVRVASPTGVLLRYVMRETAAVTVATGQIKVGSSMVKPGPVHNW